MESANSTGASQYDPSHPRPFLWSFDGALNHQVKEKEDKEKERRKKTRRKKKVRDESGKGKKAKKIITMIKFDFLLSIFTYSPIEFLIYEFEF